MKVYFIQEGDSGPIKIGVAKNVKTRMNTLQVGNPRTLHLLGTLPAKVGTERVLHNRFRHNRIGGEWFVPGDDIINYIKRLTSNERTKQKRFRVDVRPPKLTPLEACAHNRRLAHLLHQEKKWNTPDNIGLETEYTKGGCPRMTDAVE